MGRDRLQGAHLDGSRQQDQGRTPARRSVVSCGHGGAEAHKGGHKDWVFPGYRGKHLGDNAMLTLLDRMGFGHVTTHGMRSMFRTWAGEQTTTPREVVEICLAHINDDETEKAYLRTEVPGTLYLGKRRDLMNRWAKYLAGEIPLAEQNIAAE